MTDAGSEFLSVVIVTLPYEYYGQVAWNVITLNNFYCIQLLLYDFRNKINSDKYLQFLLIFWYTNGCDCWCAIDKQSKCADEAAPQKPGLSASALLKEHEKSLKAKKHLHKACTAVRASDDELGNTPNLCDAVAAADSKQHSGSHEAGSSVEPSTQPRVAQQLDRRTGQLVKQEQVQSVKPQYKVPELGRGLNVSRGGYVDLDNIPSSSPSSSGTSHDAKVKSWYLLAWLFVA